MNLNANDDMDNIRDTCSFFVGTTSSVPANTPTNAVCFGFVIKHSENACTQIAVTRNTVNTSLYIRKYYGSWSSWGYINITLNQ